ncbi:hypothetical protein N9Y42_08085 [Mariniblastus sp.]|nr:hypothetical protein [Mariniblastus sp.]
MKEESVSKSTPEPVQVVIMDRESCRLGLLDEDVAMTLIAVASEDPADWSEMLAYWPRYTSRVVPEYLSSVPLEVVSKECLPESIGESQHWVVIDLEQKRFLSGKAFDPIGRDACFAMHTDEHGDQHDPLSIHLPPWWELREQVEFSAINSPRQSPSKVPRVDREFLFGEPLIEAIADQVLEIKSNGRFAEAVKNEAEAHNPFYSLTIEVHRDWLMTPHEDLDGLYPRQMLHGGIDWIDSLAWGQRLRFEQGRGGAQIVAAPKDCHGYNHAPMGREEMAIYFDLCRELIDASWFWCQSDNATLKQRNEKQRTESLAGPLIIAQTLPTEEPRLAVSDSASEREDLIGFLNDVKLDWLTSPFEGGSVPAFILECSRRRVPRGGGVEIVGMDQRQKEQHIIDCDCPICIMMAEGKMGVGFCSIDGHHLDLDDEFAFSIHETREAWEAQQQEYAEMSAKWDAERAERERQADAGEIEKDDFASAWSGVISEAPLPGDAGGKMKLAFLLSEIVTEIQQANTLQETSPSTPTTTDPDSSASITQLNANFTSFRNSSPDELPANAQKLNATLEKIAGAYSDLIPRIADFQSRIFETARRPESTGESWGDEEIPF